MSSNEDYWQTPPEGTEIEQITKVERGEGKVRVTTHQLITTPDGDRFVGRVDIDEGTEH
ncbi:MAG: hypothetical protein GY838_12935 [bacterium]|nr:hypothetical protein [bacterium]